MAARFAIVEFNRYGDRKSIVIIQYQDFLRVEIRIGTILAAEAFPRARKPAYRLTIDFGDAGIKQSSAQLMDFYHVEDLVGHQVIAVVNFPPKNIAGFLSEVLVLGAVLEDGKVILLQPERPSLNGTRIL
jgi:tRNA-binding protein